mgnify:FL=1
MPEKEDIPAGSPEGTRFSFTVPDGARGLRLDRAIRDALDGGTVSRETLKKAISDGLCLVEGSVVTQPSRKVLPGQSVTITLPPAEGSLRAEQGDLDVLYEDESIVVCNKPAGLTVHPCPSCPGGTLIQRLASRYPSLLAMEGQRPGIVHRIDKDTSGLIIVALTEEARLKLTAAFAERRVWKEYLALASGSLPESGAVDSPIGRDPLHRVRMAVTPVSQGGREAHTRFTKLWEAPGGRASLLRVHILTGRTHQIRVHLASLGHPLLGDAVYAPGPVSRLAPRQMLHAWHIAFRHPLTGRPMSFSCPPPDDFRACALSLGRMPQNLVITGNPGSGKSTVLAMLEEEGIPCVSADRLVHDYYGPGGEAAQWLARRLGPEILTEDGSVDRKALMAAFTAAPALRHETEQLCHTLVLGDIQDFFRMGADEGKQRLAAEIPLYFECGWHRGVFSPSPVAVGVYAGRKTRGERLSAERHWDDGKISSIEGWQWDEEKKMAACRITVPNTGSREELRENVRKRLLPELDAMARTQEKELGEKLDSIYAAPVPADAVTEQDTL